MITDAERLAMILALKMETGLVSRQAELVELEALKLETTRKLREKLGRMDDDHEHDRAAFAKHRERYDVVTIDWASGARVSGDVIPFPVGGRRS